MRFRRIVKFFCQRANPGNAHAYNAVGVNRRQELAMELLVLEVLKREKPHADVLDGDVLEGFIFDGRVLSNRSPGGVLVVEAFELLRRCHGEPLSSSAPCVAYNGCLFDCGAAVSHALFYVAPAKILAIIFEYGTISKVIDKCADGIEVAARSDGKGRV